MKRSEFSVDLGKGHYKARSLFESDACEPVGPESLMHRQTLLSHVSDPSLSVCGGHPFQTLRCYHNGTAWVVELIYVTTQETIM